MYSYLRQMKAPRALNLTRDHSQCSEFDNFLNRK